MSLTEREQLKTGCVTLGIHLTDAQLDQLIAYLDAIYAANENINLTRVPRSDAVCRHVLDSLVLCRLLAVKPGYRVLDIGTGAGFPGIPIAIAFPQATSLLLDSTRKRLAVIDTIITALGITNTSTICGRAESICTSEMQGSFDIVTARAVARMDTLAGWMLPYVKVGGVAVAYKASGAEDEVHESEKIINDLGGMIDRMTDVGVPLTEVRRLLVVIKRTRDFNYGPAGGKQIRRNTK